MKKSASLFTFIVTMQLQLFADVQSDLVAAIQANDIEGVIAVVDNAAETSPPVSLDQMLAYAQGAIDSTPGYNNAAQRYLYDFSMRPFINSVGPGVIYVDPDTFGPGQIGDGYSEVVANNSRLIFQTIQDAMNFTACNPCQPWVIIANQQFYDENVTVPAGIAVTIKGVGGVILGDGQGFYYSSSDANGILTWNLDDSANRSCIPPSLTIHGIAYGGGEDFPGQSFMSNVILGGNYYTYSTSPTGPSFATQITGTITSSPTLEFVSVYVVGGMNDNAPIQSPDIGPLQMTLRNSRISPMNGLNGTPSAFCNWASASVNTLDTSYFQIGVTCASLGNVTSSGLFGPWSVGEIQPETQMLDTYFIGIFPPPVVPYKTFNVTGFPNNFTINQSSYYWYDFPTSSPWTGTPAPTVNNN